MSEFLKDWRQWLPAAAALVLFLFLARALWRRRSRRNHSPNLLFSNPGNDFSGEDFTEMLVDFLRGKLEMPREKKKRFLFFWRRRGVAESGSDFEIMALRAVQKSQDKNGDVLLEVEREVKISPGCRVDFLLKWRVSKSQWLMAIVECKHSSSLKTAREQYKRGIEQLKRYKNKLWNANFLILLTDFRLPKTCKPFRIEDRIVTVNYSIFEEMLDTINNYIVDKRKEVGEE